MHVSCISKSKWNFLPLQQNSEMNYNREKLGDGTFLKTFLAAAAAEGDNREKK